MSREFSQTFGYAKTIRELLNVYECLNRACDGAQFAKDEKLFHELFQKQTEISEIMERLIKD